MFSKQIEISYPYNIVLVMPIVIIQIFQYLQLNSSLILKLFLISNKLDSHFFFVFVIIALNRLPKAPAS